MIMETPSEMNDESIVGDDQPVEALLAQNEKLLAQIVDLKSEKQKAFEEFGSQRAKMKDLFLQKEDEEKKLREEVRLLRKQLDDTRMQLTETGLDLEAKDAEKLKYQDELTSLRQYFNATLEELRVFEVETQTLKTRNEELESELNSLKTSQQNTGSVSDIVLGNPGTMLTSLARKIKSQVGSTDAGPHFQSADNMEENMRKAKEDAEALRSLIVPLEEEINALKTKLRDTDEQLQKYHAQEEQANERIAVGSLLEIGSPTDSNKQSCDMCLNYETQLVQAQNNMTELENQLSIMTKYKDELVKETVFRKQMEEKWTESKEEHKAQVAELQNEVKSSESALAELKHTYSKACKEIKKEFDRLREERQTTKEQLERIQLENENLMGKYISKSRELQNEMIDLPDSVEKLQEMWLQQRDLLIKAKIGEEQSQENERSLGGALTESQEEQEKLNYKVKQLLDELDKRKREIHKEQNTLQKVSHDNLILEEEIKVLKSKVQKLETEKKKLEVSEGELKNSLASLQTGLETGEIVQKEFVLLSQNLQKELERLRHSDTVLRWEHEEDVLSCRGCEQPFKSAMKGKHNCRHCGRIFCVNCLNHKVTSGPNRRESKVCQVCHTLLNRESAPYFSTEPPGLNK